MVRASFNSRSIDMIPLGSMASTMKTLIASCPERDFVYTHKKDGEGFGVDTASIRAELNGISLSTYEVLEYIADYIQANLLVLYDKQRVTIT